MHESMAYRVFQEMKMCPKTLEVRELQYLIATTDTPLSEVEDIKMTKATNYVSNCRN